MAAIDTQLTLAVDTGIGVGAAIDFLAEDDFTQSGDLQIPLPPLTPGARVKSASLRVTGKAFHGLLKDLRGANITASPVVYDVDGVPQSSVAGQQAFIVDFTGIRSLLRLELNSLGTITLVLPWSGTEFSTKPAFPPPGGSGPFVPAPSSAGSESVGFVLETIKLLVQIKPGGSSLSVSDFAGDCRIETSVFPSNLKVSVGGRPPFFTRAGVLNGTAEVTGLEKDLNTLLSSATTSQSVQVTVATDTPGVLQTDFNAEHDLEIESSALARFGGQNSQNVALDALVPQDVALVFPATSVAAWKLSRLELDIEGQFPVWRTFSDQPSDTPGALGLRVNAQFSVARQFHLAQDGDLHGFSLLFRPAAEAAQLHLEVVEEQNGQPAASPAAASVDLTVPASQTFTWVNALFSSSTKIPGHRSTWIVLRAKTGSVEWAGAPLPPGPTAIAMFNSGGGVWQPYPLLNGQSATPLLRILRRPSTQENQPLLSLALQDQKATVEPGSGTASVAISFKPDAGPSIKPQGPSVSLALGVTALAAGKMTIRRAQVFYKETSS